MRLINFQNNLIYFTLYFLGCNPKGGLVRLCCTFLLMALTTPGILPVLPLASPGLPSINTKLVVFDN